MSDDDEDEGAGDAPGPDAEEGPEALAQRLGDAVHGRGLTIAVAESLTGGQLAGLLARAGDASEWFRGGVVAYASEVKHEVLGVRPGPVVHPEAAAQMAAGVARLLGADIGLAVTGAGGPDPQEGQPPGTVFSAVAVPGAILGGEHCFDGDPGEVCDATCDGALRLALDGLDGLDRAEAPG